MEGGVKVLGASKYIFLDTHYVALLFDTYLPYWLSPSVFDTYGVFDIADLGKMAF